MSLNTDENLGKEFNGVIKDFISDLIRTFPDKITRESNNNLFMILDDDSESINNMYNYCKEIYPKYFFDILYQNEDLFQDDKKCSMLLEGVDFRILWKENITENTKKIIWKYFQLILFSIITSVNTDDSFGDTTKLFEAINQDEFKEKIEETLKDIGNIFNQDISNSDGIDVSNVDQNSFFNSANIPKADELHSHINEIMNGKLGGLAKEIAEDTMKDLNFDMENEESVSGVFKELFKNPTKLMDLVKNVGTKLDTKLKSGDIKESELLEEASNLVNKMKDLPGMNDMQKMFSKMGIPGMPGMGGMGGMGGGKVNMGAFQKHMEQNLKSARMKERMRAKMEQNQNTDVKIKSNGINTDGLEELIYTSNENIERSKLKPKNRKKKVKGKKK